MNHLSAAQNIFIGREPIRKFGRFGLLLDPLDKCSGAATLL